MNGALVLDNWEGAALASGLTKQSGCVSMPVGQHLFPLSVRFAHPDLSSAPLVLRWSPCVRRTINGVGGDDGSDSSSTLQLLGPWIGTNSVWSPENSPDTGAVGGST